MSVLPVPVDSRGRHNWSRDEGLLKWAEQTPPGWNPRSSSGSEGCTLYFLKLLELHDDLGQADGDGPKHWVPAA
jgi:hypothetical protein